MKITNKKENSQPVMEQITIQELRHQFNNQEEFENAIENDYTIYNYKNEREFEVEDYQDFEMNDNAAMFVGDDDIFVVMDWYKKENFAIAFDNMDGYRTFNNPSFCSNVELTGLTSGTVTSFKLRVNYKTKHVTIYLCKDGKTGLQPRTQSEKRTAEYLREFAGHMIKNRNWTV